MIHLLIRYLGIKTKLLNEIKSTILNATNQDDIVLDLFAGSNIVGQFLMEDRTVYTNDVQKYSYVVAKAVIENCPQPILDSLDNDNIVNSIYFKENMNYLNGVFSVALSEERKIIGDCVTAINDGNINGLINENCIKRFKVFYENEPYVGHYNNILECFCGMEELYSYENYKYLRTNKDSNYYSLFCLLFPMPYFSLNQAAYIDSYRYALDKLLKTNVIHEKEYMIYLSCLIYLLHNIVTSVGDHFAQPQKFKIEEDKKYLKEIVKIINKKNLDLNKCISEKVEEFKCLKSIDKGNKCFNMDFIDVLNDDDIMDSVTSIYMDPPYTNAHYSRFYHILETLVEYNYPSFSYNGRYADDRVQSPFCIKSKALYAFDEMIRLSALKKKKIFISYSDTKQCIISKEELIGICKKYYSKVSVKYIDYLYRNFGQKPNKVKGKELIVSCV